MDLNEEEINQIEEIIEDLKRKREIINECLRERLAELQTAPPKSPLSRSVRRRNASTAPAHKPRDKAETKGGHLKPDVLPKSPEITDGKTPILGRKRKAKPLNAPAHDSGTPVDPPPSSTTHRTENPSKEETPHSSISKVSQNRRAQSVNRKFVPRIRPKT